MRKIMEKIRHTCRGAYETFKAQLHKRCVDRYNPTRRNVLELLSCSVYVALVSDVKPRNAVEKNVGFQQLTEFIQASACKQSQQRKPVARRSVWIHCWVLLRVKDSSDV